MVEIFRRLHQIDLIQDYRWRRTLGEMTPRQLVGEVMKLQQSVSRTQTIIDAQDAVTRLGVFGFTAASVLTHDVSLAIGALIPLACSMPFVFMSHQLKENQNNNIELVRNMLQGES